MSKNLKNSEVIATFVVIGLVIAWMAYSGFPNASESPKPSASDSVSAPAPVPKQLTIRNGSVICFSREDWESFKSAVMDNHITQLKLLFDAGKCQKIDSAMTVQYLDPVAGGAALVQTPGGRGAIVFLQDTK